MEVSKYKIRPSKHFVIGWMRKWDCDIGDITNMLENAYKIEKITKVKYETYTQVKGKSRKLILIKDEIQKEIFIITGAEGT